MHSRVQFAALALTLGALSGISAQTTGTCTHWYIVKSGDTCDAISAAQGVSTYQLATVNKGVIDPLCDNLVVDKFICLALALPGNDCTPVHVIAAGDTCATVAAAAGSGVSTLLSNNPNVAADCANIYVGEVLCTARTVVVVPP